MAVSRQSAVAPRPESSMESIAQEPKMISGRAQDGPARAVLARGRVFAIPAFSLGTATSPESGHPPDLGRIGLHGSVRTECS